MMPSSAKRPDRLAAVKAGAMRDFALVGTPTKRLEDWKYSDLAAALHGAPPVSGAPGAVPPSIPGAALAWFGQGVLLEAKSALGEAVPLRRLLEGTPADQDALAGSLGVAGLHADHPIISLNTACMDDGLVVRVPAGTSLPAPLHLRFHWGGPSTAAAGVKPENGYHLRILLVLEENARATIVESHTGTPPFATLVTEAKLAEGASLTHLRLEQLDGAARQSAAFVADLGARARYDGFYLSEGGHFARHEALIGLSGEQAEAHIGGIALATGAGHCDNRTVITHAAPGTKSRQAFRGVLGGRSLAAYQGCVRVRPEAQGTDARQMSRGLLLSCAAEIATKPELEIFADDVKCSHGATVGELDPAGLFFLRARGIPEAEARGMLVEAFLDEAVSALADPSLRALAEQAVRHWLDRHIGEVNHVG